MKEAEAEAAGGGVGWEGWGKVVRRTDKGWWGWTQGKAHSLPVRPMRLWLPVQRGRGCVLPVGVLSCLSCLWPQSSPFRLGGVTPWACAGPAVVLRLVHFRAVQSQPVRLSGRVQPLTVRRWHSLAAWRAHELSPCRPTQPRRCHPRLAA